MSGFAERVKAEECELSKRTDALRAFLVSSAANALPRAEQARLGAQFWYMHAYLEVLRERVANDFK